MRQSNDEMKDGQVFNGFDYDLQVWVIDGIIKDCGHRDEHRVNGKCCNAHKYAGKQVSAVKVA